MQLPVFLLILRILFIVLIYLFLMQVVLAITRDLRRASAGNGPATGNQSLGHLVVVDSGPSVVVQPGTSFDLEPQTNIGRGPTNTIQISDTFISGEHTRLWYRNGAWYVQDAGSTNGTYVNQQPAREALIARYGDIIKVGYIQFKLTP
jgi:pSer/pThr/pTyr-binding forkhead associated (FHA) protein